ncbi:hypothetical protein KIN20_005722 [Parelaphostrongylus tenuis]|uniref:Uncharacterized protein n=1 Tax=Parelaphostrongylus tenuis TaxID=148309 RepID=A0AAD5QGA6_PARTN|nr:hypothetical protein KIN20_005722 [Parelaphostrongylus tenuis]
MEKKSCHPSGRNWQAVYCEDIQNEILSNHDWQIKKDPTENYELIVKGLKSCAEFALITPTIPHLYRISTTTKEMLEKRRKLRLDPDVTHLVRVIRNFCCRRALQGDIHRHRQKKLLRAAQKRFSLKKYRRNSCRNSVPLAALMNKDGNAITYLHDMVTEKLRQPIAFHNPHLGS